MLTIFLVLAVPMHRKMPYNIDGSAHDASHQTQIPKKVAKAIEKHFPQFTLPTDNFIENADDEINALALQLLLG